MVAKKMDLSESVMYLTPDEVTVVLYSIRSSMDLYRRYNAINPQDSKMKRRQAVNAKRLVLLRSVEKKLKS
jgi:hypothetical protein